MAQQGDGVAAVRRALWRGGEWSKRQLAEQTGLSIATCNLVLNELAAAGEVAGVKHSNGRAGRNSLLYRVDERHNPVLCLRVELVEGERVLLIDVLGVLGGVIERAEERYAELAPATLAARIAQLHAAYPEVDQVSVGIPGNFVRGEIIHCDVPELEGNELPRRIRELGLGCIVGNDAQFMAYGYYRSLGNDDEVVALAYFPEGVMPGMATVYKGVVLEGASSFAGMLGFAPLGDDVAGRRELWVGEQGCELAARSVAALVTAVNPGSILCSGSLIDAEATEAVAARIAAWIPPQHLPRLQYRESLEDVYLRGLLERALDARIGGAC